MDGAMQVAYACSLPRFARQTKGEENIGSHIHADLFSIVFDLLIVWDFLFVLGSGIAAALICGGESDSSSGLGIDDNLFRVSLIGAALSPAILRERWSHLALSTVSPTWLMMRTLGRLCLATLLVFVVVMETKSASHATPAWAALWLAGAAIGVPAGRLLVLAAMQALAGRGLVTDRVAVLGSGPAADWLIATLAHARPYGVSTVSVAHGDDGSLAEGALDELVERGRRGELDRVVLALPQSGEAQLDAVAHRLKGLEVEVTSLYPAFGQRGGTVRSTQVAGVPLYVITRRPQYRWGVLAKAIEDRVLALLILLVFSPVLAVVALAVRLDSPGPVIFRQRRHGLNGTEFDVFKFRTMIWQGARAGSGEVQTSRRDGRVTRVGAFLRRTSLDELPQLLNVLSGTMSLVGPRPHPVSMRTEQRLGDEIIAEYAHRHRVKPGITGWAQVNGFRGATDTADKLRRRVEHDIYYIENWSLPFDLLILASTLFSVLFKRGNAF